MSADQVLPALWRSTAALLLLCLASGVAARSVRLGVARIAAPGVSIEGASLELDVAQASTQFGAKVKLESMQAAAVPVQARCTLSLDATGWRCAGEAMPNKARPLQASLLVLSDSENYSVQLERANTSLGMIMPKATLPDNAKVTLKSLPLDWLQPLLTNTWPTAKLGGGRLDAEARYDAAGAARGSGLALRYAVRDAGLDTHDGSVALAGLTANGELVLDWRNALQVQHTGALHGGELLWGAFYAELPATPVRLDFDVTRSSGNAWNVERFRYEDAGTLIAEFAARVEPAASQPLTTLHLLHADVIFPAAYERYAKAPLSTRGFGELAPQGRVSGSARWEADGLVAFDVQSKGLTVADGGGRFAIDDVVGSLAWEREGELAATFVAWRSAQVYRLALGGAQTQWRSRAGELALVAPATVPFAGGTLEIPHLVLKPDAAKGERLRASFAAHDVDLGSLSEAFGWPKFAGKLGGAVPAIRYVGEHIELEGGLFLRLFDGSVNLTNLALERPFGIAPSLSADMVLNSLDLQPLTSAFGFGEITGHLSGRIDALRTVDWAPVAFAAELHTEGGGKLSQRAVNNLTAVGGGGIAGGLQASVLRIFDTFGYSRIGLRCQLHNNVCRMGGIDSSAAGYTIVEGRGLPHVTVVGHQSDVDWPTLVARLKAATSGTAPIIH